MSHLQYRQSFDYNSLLVSRVFLLLDSGVVLDAVEAAGGLARVAGAGHGPGVRHFAPVLRRDQDGGEAHREVAPLEDVSAGSPPAFDTQGVGGVAPLALEVDTQPLKTLTLPHCGRPCITLASRKFCFCYSAASPSLYCAAQ